MLDKLSYRWAIIIFVLLLGGFWLSPNFVNYGKKSVFGRNKITPGLDIQGGIHLVLGVDVNEVVREQIARTAKDISGELSDNKINYKAVNIVGANKSEIEIQPTDSQSQAAIVKYLAKEYPTILQVISQSPSKIDIKFYDAYLDRTKKQVVNQAIAVIRNRIDEFGVAEPSIAAEGEDRIVVQLPGIQNANRAIELINKTAMLNFRIVSNAIALPKLVKMISDAEKKYHFELTAGRATPLEDMQGSEPANTKVTAAGTTVNKTQVGSGKKLTNTVKGAAPQVEKLHYLGYVRRLNKVLASKLPKNTMIVFQKLPNAANIVVGRRPYLVDTGSHLTGANLDDAWVQNGQFGRPEVDFRFTLEGKKLFAALTKKAAGGQLAIVLDDVVKSAPMVKREIDSDQARITLGSGNYDKVFSEAKFIATALRAGALPAALEPLEQQTVGPSLGSASIQRAKFASIIASLAVFIWMLLYYRGAGLIADLSLIFNLFLTFAVLTAMGATLDLAGIAGLALTIGMAVDANVIVYERIREEMRKGASPAGAVRDGYHNAYPSIFDADICTILTCFVLIYYGTGPIRGFAVTLAIGMVTSMFTAVFFSRTVMETLVNNFNYKVFNITPNKTSAHN